MTFPRSLLVKGEELVLDLHPHWVVLVGPSVMTLLVLGAWGAVLSHLPDGAARAPAAWLTIAAGALVLLWFPVRALLVWATSHFVVTTERIIHREGVLARASMEIPLEAINDVRFHQSVFERVIGAGDLIIESAGEAGREVFEDIRHPEQVQRTIYEQGERNTARMHGAGPASAAAELERLASLRDRGILTEAEFQAQKDKLLTR